MADETELWPNQQEIIDGVVPTDEVSQDPNLFADYTDHTAVEMEG
jgi:hypothetical protein